MKRLHARSFAPWGLYLALAAALVAGAIYIIYKELTLPMEISLGLIVIGLAGYAILDPQSVRRAFTGRQAKYGSNALVMTLAFGGILVVINFIAYKNPVRWDITEGHQNTLAPETIALLQKLPQTVTADAFYTSRLPSDTARSLLTNFKYDAKGKFDFKFIDPEANPVAAQNAKVTQDGTIVLTMAGRSEQVSTVDEQDIDAALIRLSNPGTRVVYFLSGHGEYDPNGSGDTSYSQVKNALQLKNYTVKTLNLLTDPKVPSDALAIIIAGPKKPLADSEIKLLQDYQSKGGALVVMEEPLPVTQFGNAPDPLADYLSKSWGLTLGNDIIIDMSSQVPTFAIASQYGSSPITDKLQNIVTVFPTARSVQTTTTPPQNVTQTVLVNTSANSWGETDFAGLQNNQATFNQGSDLKGPLPIAVSAVNNQTKARVVVIGDSDFASDADYSAYANGDFLINSIDWAAGQESLINLTPKQTVSRVMLPPQRTTLGLILFVSIFALPGLVVVSGVTTWIQRRRRG